VQLPMDPNINYGSDHMKALAFGEVLWDMVDGTALMGGAPYNVSAHLRKMGAEAFMISSVGRDELGERAVSNMAAANVSPEFVNLHDNNPTGTVDVVLNESGEPSYTINENTAWDDIRLTRKQLSALWRLTFDLFIFGNLSQRTAQNRKTLNAVLENINAGEVFYDVNLRQPYYKKEWIETSLERSTIVKLNKEESELLSVLLFSAEYDLATFVQELAETYELKIACVTLGAEGALLYTDRLFNVSGHKIAVADTIGAGDGFSAGFLRYLLSGFSPEVSANFGCKVGAYVASQPGAIPEYSAELEEAINSKQS